MKAGIITHYNVHNHGAVLQMYALTKQLGSLGYDAKALQFQKNYDFMGREKAANKYAVSLRSVPYYINYLLKQGIGKTIFNYKKRNILQEFRNEYQLTGDFYSEAKDLSVVVIGSDEIFSIEAGPNPWYYGFGIPCKNQISYAASFGPTTLDDIQNHNVDAMIAAGINQLKNVSVRDENSRVIVKQLTGREAVIVCDPVLLYGFQQEKEQFVPADKDYLLVYSYDKRMNDLEDVKKIRVFADSKGWKIYSVGFYHKWCDKNINADPLELLGWFRHARFVVTDTFHGSVLSILCNVPMAVKLADNQNKLRFLLEEYALTQRILRDYDELNRIADTEIDFETLNRSVAERHDASLQYLISALEG